MSARACASAALTSTSAKLGSLPGLADRDLLDAKGAAADGDQVEDLRQDQAVDDMARNLNFFDERVALVARDGVAGSHGNLDWCFCGGADRRRRPPCNCRSSGGKRPIGVPFGDAFPPSLRGSILGVCADPVRFRRVRNVLSSLVQFVHEQFQPLGLAGSQSGSRDRRPPAEPKPAAKPPAASRPAAPTAPKKAAPPKPDTDWGQLASALGVAPTPSPPAQAAAPAQPPPTPSRPAPREATAERDETGGRRRPPAHEPESRGRDRNRDRERPPRESQSREPQSREPQARDERRAALRPASFPPLHISPNDPKSTTSFSMKIRWPRFSRPRPPNASSRPRRQENLRKTVRAASAVAAAAADAVRSAIGSRATSPRQAKRAKAAEPSEISFEGRADEFEVVEREEYHVLDEGPTAEGASSAEAAPGDDSERRGRPKRRRRRGSGRGRGGRDDRPEAKSESSRAPSRAAADEDGDNHHENDLRTTICRTTIWPRCRSTTVWEMTRTGRIPLATKIAIALFRLGRKRSATSSR